ncbi:hypothetical protein V1520DRAFT_345839 [Lipomyces starkeyi]|uniref:Cysteine protease n=1 Tax=Lipomyces starkeyi NRRL Y-11557 TaxID=675824 RepID=A0A1E3PXR2_LIPST|nr:hypothetical protein LIPSTDRAFT_75215 [Lipomyces starkeyi NRRL Y-11557]
MDNIQRFVNYLLDPEAVNTDLKSPLWSLGIEYSPIPDPPPPPPPASSRPLAVPQHITVASAQSKLSSYLANASNALRKSSPSPEQANSDGQAIPEVPELVTMSWPSAFVENIGSKLYMTYRTDFPLIPRTSNGPSFITVGLLLRGQLNDKSGFTSDVGWGCMVRSAQTLLANSLIALHNTQPGSTEEKNIISWFADDPQAPFSIQNFVHHGWIACGKHPGEWFGPSAAARCMQITCSKFKDANLLVYIGGDAGDVYEDSFMRVSGGPEDFKPTLVLLGIRLGIEKVTPVYHEALKFCLRVPQAVGIAGGRPSSSHYFFGYQNSNFFYFDPHYPRKALPYRADYESYTDDEVASVHTRRVRSIKVEDMDPSMLIGFLIRNMDDWKDWISRVENFQGRKFIHISKSEPMFGQGNSINTDGYVDLGLNRCRRSFSVEPAGNDSEDFEHIALGDDDDDNGVQELESDDDGEQDRKAQEDEDDLDFDKCVT